MLWEEIRFHQLHYGHCTSESENGSPLPQLFTLHMLIANHSPALSIKISMLFLITVSLLSSIQDSVHRVVQPVVIGFSTKRS